MAGRMTLWVRKAVIFQGSNVENSEANYYPFSVYDMGVLDANFHIIYEIRFNVFFLILIQKVTKVSDRV